MATKRVLVILLRLLLPAVFILSALSKLVAIDQFELYIFSYGLLPLNLCYIAARLCIGAPDKTFLDLDLDAFRKVVELNLFGTVIPTKVFVPVMAKNEKGAIVNFCSESALRPLTRVVGSCLVVPLLVLPFLISVPDSWYFRASHEPYDSQALQEALQLQHLERRDAHLVAFVTRGCPYCRMTQQKINGIASRHDIDTTRIRYIEPADLPGDLFLRVTYGARPLVLLLDADTVVATYHFRNIDEAQIASLLATH